MTRLMLDPMIKAKCDEAIVVTGVARSGTTIMGKLLHSMEGIEYVNEPAMLYSLISLIDRLDRDLWELLYETYLFEEFFFNALAGRALNFNLEDETSIYKVKDEGWIRQRLSRSLRKRDADKEIEQSRIAYKMTDIVPFIPRIQEYYPHTQIIMMLREANEVFHSIMERQWFSDEMLRTKNVVWPNCFVNGMRIPYWVLPADYDYWLQADELHRTAYYYVRAHEGMDKLKNLKIVRYEELVTQPKSVIFDVAETLGLKFGPKTPDLIAQVKKPEKQRDKGYVERLQGPLKESVLYFSRLAGINLEMRREPDE